MSYLTFILIAFAGPHPKVDSAICHQLDSYMEVEHSKNGTFDKTWIECGLDKKCDEAARNADLDACAEFW